MSWNSLCWRVCSVVFAVSLQLAPVRSAEDPVAVLPPIARDSTIQSPAEYFGFPLGSRHLRHDQVTDYLRYLADRSDRVALVPYGKTFGQRPLFVLVITSPDNHARLPRIRSGRKRLTAGQDLPPGQLSNEPVVMWMGYAVHGDEASTINAAPLVAYHLASAQSDEMDATLDQAVFLLDPCLNPDGADRFANWVNDNRGRFASPENVDREHQQPWPGGRSNYYWFDLNRDWLPLVQPESQGRVKLFHQWKPNVVLDYHEMGGGSTYFFQPGIPARNNPLSPAENTRLTRLFAQGFAAVMDQALERYYTEESFDDFYIGKGSTYPDLHGAVGILFEQGSTRGLRLKNETTDRHFRDTVANQVRTSLSAMESLIQYKAELLAFQTDFYRQALEDSRASTISAYLLTGSKSRVAAAARLLKQHAISSHANQVDLRISGQDYLSGEVLIIPAAQPQSTLIRSLVETPQSFRENIFYDVSAWHLPSAFDLQLEVCESDIPNRWMTESAAPPTSALDDVSADDLLGVAFGPTELESATWVARLMQMGAKIQVSMVPLAAGTDSSPPLPAGTFVVLRSMNRSKWKSIISTVKRWEKNAHTALFPLVGGLNPTGPDLGSDQLRVLPACRPALVVGNGTTSTVAGAIWHYLDHRLEQPATLIDTERLARTSLQDYSCVILPSGSYAGWGTTELEVLSEYARQGGTIVAIGAAASWLQRQGLAITHAELGGRGMVGERTGSGEADSNPEVREAPSGFAQAADLAALERIAGAFFETEIDPTHPLGFGFTDARVPVFRDSTSVFGRPSNRFQLVASYENVIAGYVSDRNRNRLAGTAAVWVQNVGSGRIVMIADNPVFRGYTRSSERFLSNAILLGPITSIPRVAEEEE